MADQIEESIAKLENLGTNMGKDTTTPAKAYSVGHSAKPNGNSKSNSPVSANGNDPLPEFSINTIVQRGSTWPEDCNDDGLNSNVEFSGWGIICDVQIEEGNVIYSVYWDCDSSKCFHYPVKLGETSTEIIVVGSDDLTRKQKLDKEKYPTWDEGIIGQERARNVIDVNVFLPNKHPSVFPKRRNGGMTMLFHGPPGTGKTMVAQALANAYSNSNLVTFSPSDQGTRSGETEIAIRDMFRDAKKKRTVIFMDEADSFLGKRSDRDANWVNTTKNQLLEAIDDFRKNCKAESIFIACTNLLSSIDEANLRRFDDRCFFDLPTTAEREKILDHYIQLKTNDTSSCAITVTSGDIKSLADKTRLFSPSDLADLVDGAFTGPQRETLRSQHFKIVIVDGHRKFEPCAADAYGAFAARVNELPNDSLKQMRAVNISDFLEELKHRTPTMSSEGYLKHLEQDKKAQK